MKRLLLLPFLLLTAGLCAGDEFVTRFAICYPKTPANSTYKVLKRFMKKEFPGTEVYRSMPKRANLPYVVLTEDVTGYRMPEPADMIRFGQGIEGEDAKRLQVPKTMVQIEYYGHRDHALDAVKESVHAALAAAEAGDGFLWDDHTHQMFSTKAWRESRVDTFAGYFPYVPKHVTIHVYPDGEGYRAVTLGMAKFAAPDLVVEAFPRSWRDQIVSLLQVACQVSAPSPPRNPNGSLALNLDMIQHPGLRKELLDHLLPGARKFAFISTAAGKHREGDAPNPLLELTFSAGEGETRNERMAATLAMLFGRSDESEHGPVTEQMKIRRTQIADQLPALKALVNKGLPTGERILVKAPFTDEITKKREWMWVEVMFWNDDTITGTLVNQPNWLPQLAIGARVRVTVDQVHDVQHHLADGTVKGASDQK